jgi:hypothetical protein
MYSQSKNKRTETALKIYRAIAVSILLWSAVGLQRLRGWEERIWVAEVKLVRPGGLKCNTTTSEDVRLMGMFSLHQIIEISREKCDEHLPPKKYGTNILKQPMI